MKYDSAGNSSGNCSGSSNTPATNVSPTSKSSTPEEYETIEQQNESNSSVPLLNTPFTVSSVDDFIKVLKQNNVVFEDWQGKQNSVTLRVDGVKQIYFEDPDGYWIEINDAKD